MNATLLPAHEQSFFATGKVPGNKQFTLVEKEVTIKNSDVKLRFTECRNHDESYFYKCAGDVSKTQIVLHFTAGYLKGDVDVLTKPGYHVSVPYIIPRNGKILNMWDPACWSYHLGIRPKSLNKSCCKQSIAIELSNIGLLKKEGKYLKSIYSDVYCTLEETQFYQEVSTGFRGYNYFATYTKEQYESLNLLLKYLTGEFNIPWAFLPEDRRYECNPKTTAEFKGIVTHANYRKDKWDIGPAFDWNKMGI